jgi:hypothetical protein
MRKGAGKAEREPHDSDFAFGGLRAKSGEAKKHTIYHENANKSGTTCTICASIRIYSGI